MTRTTRVSQAAAAALALLLCAPAALSSGGGGGGGGGFGSSSTPTPRRAPPPRDPETELYNTGKHVAKKKLMCRSCPHADEKLDAAFAQRLLLEPALTETLDEFDRGVLAIYLERRFKLPPAPEAAAASADPSDPG